MQSIIEHSTVKVIALLGEGLIYMGVVFGFVPAFEFVVMQVDQHIFINPYTKILLDEIKQVFAVITMMLVLVKVLIGIKKIQNEKK